MRLDDVAAVLLDMDGTLVDSDAAVERAWTTWAGEHGVEAAEALAVAHGAPADRTVRRLLPDLDDAAVAAAAARQLALQYDDLGGVTALAGAHALLAVLARRGIPWAVVTSSDVKLARARLGAAGIDPPLLVTVEDVAAGKPDPEGYLLAAHRLGVGPEACLVVEDAEPGLAAARSAGMRVAALRGLDGDLRLPDLGRLAVLLERAGDTGDWWADRTGYQVYLPSFADSDGDGWGDLPGLVDRLDHLADLGVDLLWLSPVHPSPFADAGYDVADYTAVHPRFGSLADLDRLLAETAARGMRVLLDLVPNHTSDQHPWFRSARRSREDPHRGYYHWRDPAPGGGPPNNWVSAFGGPAWTLDEATGQYYLHLFSPAQPDLNWEDPAVAAEFDAILRFWLDRGVAGFRVDVANTLVKAPGLPDNPELPPERWAPTMTGLPEEFFRFEHLHEIDQPGVLDVHRRWRDVVAPYAGMLLGEVYLLDPAALARYLRQDGLHLSFWFALVESGWAPERFAELLRAADVAGPHLAWVQSSHDRSRAVSARRRPVDPPP